MQANEYAAAVFSFGRTSIFSGFCEISDDAAIARLASLSRGAACGVPESDPPRVGVEPAKVVAASSDVSVDIAGETVHDVGAESESADDVQPIVVKRRGR